MDHSIPGCRDGGNGSDILTITSIADLQGRLSLIEAVAARSHDDVA